jgi:DNA-binding CsgD family transcriptional regulator
MAEGTPSSVQRIRTAEVVAALSLATDLGTGFPLEHSLYSTVVAMRLADRLGADRTTLTQTYYGSMLVHIGCTVDAELAADLFEEGATLAHFVPAIFGTSRQTVAGVVRALAGSAGPAPVRALRAVGRLPRAVRGLHDHRIAICEVARMLADHLSLPETVGGMLGHLTERWDGKGQPAGLHGDELPLALRIVHVVADAAIQRSVAARLVAVADAYHAMTQPRPHRPALSPRAVADTLADECRAGWLCPDAVAAVLGAAGQQAPRAVRPAGLTERETQVVALLARGRQTKQIARALGISVKTADRHVQNAYAKMGVSTRAAATLFAMRHGLIAWGELPIEPSDRRS